MFRAGSLLEDREGESDAPSTVLGVSVAVLEDDDELRESILVPALQAVGFAVEGFADATSLYRRMLATSFDLVVLDIGLPDADGLEVARYLSDTLPIGIVTLSGRGSATDRVRGLSESVDAWLTKPVDTDMLVATLRSVARRLKLSAERDAGHAPAWCLSPASWRLVAPDGRSVALNLMERRLMLRLLASSGDVVTHDDLLAELSGDSASFDRHRLEILIHRLRRKVQAAIDRTLPLRSVRGSGYVMLTADERASKG